MAKSKHKKTRNMKNKKNTRLSKESNSYILTKYPTKEF